MKKLDDVNSVDGWFGYWKAYGSLAKTFLPKNATVVEVGSWLGRSTIGMAIMNRDMDKPCKIYAVDTWEGSSGCDDEDYHKEIKSNLLQKENTTLYEKFISNVKEFGLEDTIIPIRKTSEEASKGFEDESIDFLIIDAAHDFDNVYNDLKCWIPKVKKGGIVIGDDHSPSFPSVEAAVVAYFGRGNYELFDNSDIGLSETWWKKL